MVAPRQSTSLTEAHALTESEETECRHRIAAILRTIEDGADKYLDYLDSYLKIIVIDPITLLISHGESAPSPAHP